MLCSLMLVGWGGNNGATVTAGILANKQYVAPHAVQQRTHFVTNVYDVGYVMAGATSPRWRLLHSHAPGTSRERADK
jgi:hypothetical protein